MPAVLGPPTVLVSELNLIAIVEAAETIRSVDGGEMNPNVMSKLGGDDGTPTLVGSKELHPAPVGRLRHGNTIGLARLEKRREGDGQLARRECRHPDAYRGIPLIGPGM